MSERKQHDLSTRQGCLLALLDQRLRADALVVERDQLKKDYKAAVLDRDELLDHYQRVTAENDKLRRTTIRLAVAEALRPANLLALADLLQS